MLNVSKLIITVFVLGLATVAAGCQASGKSSASAPLDHAVMCSKCETVWVPEASGQGTKVTVMRSTAKMTCPTCDATAKGHLTSGGKLVLHECPDCKVTPQRVSSVHRPTHPKGTH